MTYSKSMAKAIKKYEQEKVERIMFRVPKGEKARIQAHAASRGESTNAFIYRAINETIQREGETGQNHD
ncbi:MAG: hypothetical protein ACLTXB_00185 [Flintibacter sp.]